MEPERHIEKILRTYAKKRREQAGAPLELHPASRRLLQDEVGRRAQKSGGDNFLSMALALLRRKLVLASCVAALLLAGLLLLVPSGRKGSETTLAMERNPRPPTESGSINAPAPASSPAATAPLSQMAVPLAKDFQDKRKTRDSHGNGEDGPRLENRDTPGAGRARLALQNQPAAVTAHDTGGFSGVGGGAWGAAVAFTNGGSMASTRLLLGDTAPGAGALAHASSNSQLYYRFDTDSSSAVGVTLNAEPSRQSTPVLASFQIQQNGNGIRIVDGDGSVYSGSIELSKPVREERLYLADNLTSATKSAVQEHYLYLPQRYRIQVHGTNQTLRQNVTFDGVLIALTNGIPRQEPFNLGALNATSSLTPAALPQLPLATCRIRGTAVIENSNPIQINASPARP